MGRMLGRPFHVAPMEHDGFEFVGEGVDILTAGFEFLGAQGDPVPVTGEGVGATGFDVGLTVTE